MNASLRRATALRALACAVAFLCWPAAADAPPRLEPAPNAALPSFALDRLDGDRVDLAALRGSAVLVHFFATWCEPCKAEFATLTKLAHRRPALKILAINVGEPASRVRTFAQTEGITLPILLDADRALSKAWRVNVLPTTIVLDEDHRARLAVEGDLDWSRDDTISALDTVTARKTSQENPTPITEGRTP